MSDLRRVWDVNWAEVEELETRLLREMTPAQGIHDYFALRAEFEPWLQRDELAEGKAYEQHAIQFQAKLFQLEQRRGHSMSSLLEAVTQLQTKLDQAGIPSALIDGLAVGAWAKARVTRDVDLKILLRRDESQKLWDLLKEAYRSLQADPVQTLQRNGIVFVVNQANVRLDLALADTEFDEILIARAKQVDLGSEQMVRVCSPEDLVILKLIAARPQDQIDVSNVIRRQAENLDDTYITNWLVQFEKMIDDSTLLRSYRQLREQNLRP